MNGHGKIGVVTGGANGIGRCIVENFLAIGASVAFIDLDQERAQQIVSHYSPDKILFVAGDLTVEKVMLNFVEQIKQKFGKVDFLINNACLSKKGILSDCSYDDFNYTLKIGVSVPYMLSKLLLPIFTDNGTIINISSTRGIMSQPDTESYSAAKGGINALTHALSVSLAHKVRVNAISPGWIDTGNAQHSDEDQNQHPAGRIGKPDDIAEMVLFLCSDASSFITGENITIDGGMSKQMIYHNDYGWSLNLAD